MFLYSFLLYFWRCFVISNNKEHQINEEIRDKELRIIDADGTQLGIMSSKQALEIAYEKDLDLVKIALRQRRRFAGLWITANSVLNRLSVKRKLRKIRK